MKCSCADNTAALIYNQHIDFSHMYPFMSLLFTLAILNALHFSNSDLFYFFFYFNILEPNWKKFVTSIYLCIRIHKYSTTKWTFVVLVYNIMSYIKNRGVPFAFLPQERYAKELGYITVYRCQILIAFYAVENR